MKQSHLLPSSAALGIAAGMIGLIVLLTASHLSVAQESGAAVQSPAALPDLVLNEFTMVPARPRVGDPVTLSIQVRNSGLGNAPGWRVSLYIDPPVEPPTNTISETNTVAMFVTRPPETTDLVEFAGYTFTTTGCQHVVYAWADPREGIPESDETNNLRAIHVCVDPAQGGEGQDNYEPDTECSSSVPLIDTTGLPQIRSFAPINDVDYVRFVGTQGVTYTVTAAGTGRDAEPSLELADSCNFVPPFGTTARAAFASPASTTYYLKLHNVHENPDTNKTTYELTVRAESAGGDQPVLSAMTPTSGLNDQPLAVTLTGAQFLFPSLAEMCSYQNGTCATNCVPLLNVIWRSAQKLEADVPAYLPTGGYCVQVTNPGGKRSRILNAFTVLPAASPRVVPAQGYGNVSTELYIYGISFANVISLNVGAVELMNPRLVNSAYIVATLPPGLAPGVYSLTARYATGNLAIIPNAFTALPYSQAAQDLYAQNDELWLDPAMPRANEPFGMGLVVHRISGTMTLANLPVRFAVNGIVIGDIAVPLLAVEGQAGTARLPYTPPIAGVYTLTALIDPAGLVPEMTRINNLVTRTISVSPAAIDKLAPHVDRLTINDGQGQTVTLTQVKLSSTATDFPDPGGSGVADLRYIELEYNQGVRLWVPVRDSSWLNYATQHLARDWTLTPVGGVHYIQAWARDAAGNISRYPNQQSVNYLPPVEQVGRDQARVYRQRLDQGDILRVTLTPVSGDPDLYIWPPDWPATPPWVSNQYGSAVEQMTFAAPITGVYQIEVYGYSSAQYGLTFITGVPTNTRHLLLNPVTDKPWPFGVQPLIAATNEPPYIQDLVGISINGPTKTLLNSALTLTATLIPASATPPDTYTWSPMPGSGQGTAMANYVWTTPGSRTITVVATTASGTIVTDTHLITVSQRVYLPLVAR
jgi:hypothetical protein